MDSWTEKELFYSIVSKQYRLNQFDGSTILENYVSNSLKLIFSANDEFAKCKRYDLSGLNSISPNFDVAMSQRSDRLPTVECSGTGLELSEQFQFDQTENISSIVTDVWNKA